MIWVEKTDDGAREGRAQVLSARAGGEQMDGPDLSRVPGLSFS